MGKTESDSLKKIETSFLKKHGYFDYNKYKTITWTNSWYNDKSSIGIDKLIVRFMVLRITSVFITTKQIITHKRKRILILRYR